MIFVKNNINSKHDDNLLSSMYGVLYSHNTTPKIFLGGTCNNSTWRDELIPMLENIGVNYFNPVVDVWDENAQKEEIKQREICDIVLYTITKEIFGVYSIAEVVDDSNKRPEKTILCILYNGFDADQQRSLKSVARLVKNNGAIVVDSLNDIIKILK